MTRESAAILIIGALSAASCVHRPAGEPQTVLPIISTTAPATSQPIALAEGPAHAAPTRLTSVRLLVLTLQRQYLMAEGPARRSMKFVELAGAIDETRRKEPPVTEMEAIEVLGSPDYARHDDQGGTFAYRCKTEAGKDALVVVSVDERGFVRKVDWDTEAPARVQLPPFPQWRERPPATAPSAGGGYLGVRVATIAWWADGFMYLGYPGAEINLVLAGSPAQRAGLRPGDRVEELEGQFVNAREFPDQVARLHPGQTVTLTILRPKDAATRERLEFHVTLGERASAATKPEHP